VEIIYFYGPFSMAMLNNQRVKSPCLIISVGVYHVRRSTAAANLTKAPVTVTFNEYSCTVTEVKIFRDEPSDSSPDLGS
jgi:hypothetical protein